jgi:hypothetical protein
MGPDAPGVFHAGEAVSVADRRAGYKGRQRDGRFVHISAGADLAEPLHAWKALAAKFSWPRR